MQKLSGPTIINHRLFTILALGFASGLPYALRGTTLQAWFASVKSEVSLVTVGTILMVAGLPYLFKVLWAPLMDHFGFEKFGKRKGWILMMQAGVVVALMLLAQTNPSENILMVGVLAFTLAFFSASQDISITAYQADVLPSEERGLGVSYYVFAYRIALLISGGLALIFADYFGWKLTYELMAVIFLLSIFPTLKAPAVYDIKPVNANIFHTTLQAWRNMFQREQIILVALFILFYKFGDALALQLMTFFLMKGLGFTLTELGLTYKTVSFIAAIAGGFVGGIILTRWNIFKALLWFGLAQAFSNLTFVWLAMSDKQFVSMSLAVFLENFCSGLSTAALFSFMLSLCDKRYSATQYALLSVIASSGNILLGPVAAFMIEQLGWIQFFIWTFVLCFPGIFFLLLLMRDTERVGKHAHAELY